MMGHGYTTKHGKRRWKERVKLPIRTMRRMSEKAWREGKGFDQLPYALQLKLQSMDERLSHGDPTTLSCIRVYQGHAFVFREGFSYPVLITVFELEDPELGDGIQVSRAKRASTNKRNRWREDE